MIIDLEQTSNIFSTWFVDDYLKASPEKYIFLSGKSDAQVIVGNASIVRSNCEKLLGIKIAQKRSFGPSA